jgi:hypothetical protein
MTYKHQAVFKSNNKILLIDEVEVAKILTMDETLEATEEAFREKGFSTGSNALKVIPELEI